MKYIIGTIVIIIGFLITWKAEWMLRNFGRIGWADRHLGNEGGTRLFYKLIGITAIILSFLYMGGIIESLLLSIFGSSIESME